METLDVESRGKRIAQEVAHTMFRLRPHVVASALTQCLHQHTFSGSPKDRARAAAAIYVLSEMSAINMGACARPSNSSSCARCVLALRARRSASLHGVVPIRCRRRVNRQSRSPSCAHA